MTRRTTLFFIISSLILASSSFAGWMTLVGGGFSGREVKTIEYVNEQRDNLFRCDKTCCEPMEALINLRVLAGDRNEPQRFYAIQSLIERTYWKCGYVDTCQWRNNNILIDSSKAALRYVRETLTYENRLNFSLLLRDSLLNISNDDLLDRWLPSLDYLSYTDDDVVDGDHRDRLNIIINQICVDFFFRLVISTDSLGGWYIDACIAKVSSHIDLNLFVDQYMESPIPTRSDMKNYIFYKAPIELATAVLERIGTAADLVELTSHQKGIPSVRKFYFNEEEIKRFEILIETILTRLNRKEEKGFFSFLDW